MNWREKWLLLIIVSLPLIDMATFFTRNLPITIGIIVRMILLGAIFIHFFKHFTLKSLPTLIVLISFTTSFLLNFFLKESFHILPESQFYFKSLFAIMIFYIVIQIVKDGKITVRAILSTTTIATIITGITYWLALLTGTSSNSYAYIKAGYAGWFFSANELSVILLILLSLSLLSIHKKTGMLAYFLAASILPMIGTKTALFGGLIIIIAYGLFTLLLTSTTKYALLLYTGIGALFFLIPFVIPNDTAEHTNESQPVKQALKGENLLSSRDIYLAATRTDYVEASFIRKVFGLSYAGDYKRGAKMIEMDMHDLFFSYGIAGAVSFLILLSQIAMLIFPSRLQVTPALLVTTTLLVCAIAITAGHVLFAPAVMSYVGILLSLSGLTSIHIKNN